MKTVEENKALCQKMPYLIPRNLWTDKISDHYDYSYIRGDYELPEGWKNLFLQMCEDIRQPLTDANCLQKFRFSQIKEKYGTMRCYHFGAPSSVYDIIRKYEYMSEYVCEDCGKPATKRSVNGWIESWCDSCFKKHILPEYVDNSEFESIEFNPVIHINTYTSEGKLETTQNCEAEWTRLFREDKD